MDDNVGLCIVGMNGAVATTSICGLELIRKDLIQNPCLISEGYLDPHKRTIEMRKNSEDSYSISNDLNLCSLDNIIISGWDICEDTIYSSAKKHGIIDKDLLSMIKEETEDLIPWKGYSINESEQDNYMVIAQKIANDIDNFRRKNKLKNVIVINLQPTEKHIKWEDIHFDLKKFENALKMNHPSINNSMVYAYGALKAGAAYIEFTPNNSIDTPALIRLACDKRLPICGKDGKTGQTFIKSVLAQALRSRQLKIEGWYSTNILGNNDGKNLSDPPTRESKIKSKTEFLNKLVGYNVGNHIVDIVYYPPRGDNKEAWDNIDIKGFIDAPMQIKINFLCRDSILAAPMVIDLCRFMNFAMDRGMYGIQSWLALFFKQPLFNQKDIKCFGFFEQEKVFVDFVLGEILSRTHERKRSDGGEQYVHTSYP